MSTSTWRLRMAQLCVGLLLVTSLVVSTYAVAPPTVTRANGSPPAPTEPLYDVYVNTPHVGSVSSSAMAFTGRGSWTDVTVSAGVLAVPLFAVGTDAKVPALSSIVVTGLGGASVSAIRAALDGVSSLGDGCRGGTVAEKAAIRGYYWDGDSWEAQGATAYRAEDRHVATTRSKRRIGRSVRRLQSSTRSCSWWICFVVPTTA